MNPCHNLNCHATYGPSKGLIYDTDWLFELERIDYGRTMLSLILASQSPYRRQQLENFGLKFTAVKPEVDEEKLKLEGPKDLTELTRFLATKKAQSLKSKFSGDIILGSDQLADLDGERLDKPGSPENAFAQLKKMSGREHHLLTSLAMVKGGDTLVFTDITTIRLKVLSDDLIRAYLQIDKPFDCAGSYKFERAGLSLVESVKSHDPSAIQGLPMLSLMHGLERYKISVADFWESK